MELEFSRQSLEKYKIAQPSFQWEPSFSMRTDGQIYMTKILVAFRNSANLPKTRLKKKSVHKYNVHCS